MGKDYETIIHVDELLSICCTKHRGENGFVYFGEQDKIPFALVNIEESSSELGDYTLILYSNTKTPYRTPILAENKIDETLQHRRGS